MQRLTEAGGILTLGYPAWLGVVLAACGIALAAYLARRRAPSGQALGVAVATLICFWGAVHFSTYKARIGPDAVSLHEPFRNDLQIAWPDVARASVEQRSSGRGGRSNFVVFYSSAGEELKILLTGLSLDEQSRVIEVLQQRLPRGHLD